MKVETYLPIFGGFYGGYFDITEMCSDYESNEGDDMTEEISDSFNYKECTTELAIKCVEVIEKKLIQYKLVKSIKFQKVVSPKFYNFDNDSIYILTDINIKEVKKFLIEEHDSFEEYIKDKYTSCDGYHSGYSSDYLDWMNDESLSDSHKLGSILNFCLERIAEFDEVFEDFDYIPQLWLYNEAVYESGFYIGMYYTNPTLDN